MLMCPQRRKYYMYSVVHRVMSMLYFTLIIAFLIAIEAAPKTKDYVLPGPTTSPTLQLTNWTTLQQNTTAMRESSQVHNKKVVGNGTMQTPSLTVDPKLFKKSRFRSPRVLFSTLPPPLVADVDNIEYLDSEDYFNRTARSKRTVHPVLHRGEYSVCDSISVWVGDKTKATDIKGHEVTVLGEININNNIIKQYFFETKCLNPKPGGCRGIDSKNWNSYCTTTHTFVRALTEDKQHAAWRFIRIDTACVCVLSRKTWKP
ncbi:nerve growth factor isoform X1 [Latimeria chalumnae]|uniref:nerve growth factor isoform X1 n=1 Tax=Latimeria chalumnae TaxID=7897 RepID=UPI0003C10743|nr:PREDICTED: beta-nerve growth factor isoform X1 [Latimeria chalumnae]XP_005988531.1 PREDICTED: beta-nerve growth factor isoform X1 [Latimeria chalumnae]XP_014352493.1 PREDICTED: beta-nerve growth factor isoform X1 [Latimeria chalumnae]|eukprot:XP_005988530.1 PREDICTED: beta-nerve growth factor isoform X1 [Latimeria chalumnae]